MLEETRLFFNEVLRRNLPVTEFLHSDWTFLNERLAEHYDIDGVKGVAMRRVSLKPEHHRGGAPTAWLASKNGDNWRHLTDGQTKLKGIKEADGDPSVMPGTWGIAGGRSVFVTGGYMKTAATPDFGKKISTFSLRSFNGEPKATASNCTVVRLAEALNKQCVIDLLDVA